MIKSFFTSPDKPVVFLVDWSVIENQGTLDFLVSAIEDAGYDPADCTFFCTTEKGGSPDLGYRLKLVDAINAHPRKAVIGLGNNSVFLLGFRKKPEGVTALRAKIHSCSLFDAPVYFLISPSVCTREPIKQADFLCDIGFVFRSLEGTQKEQVDLEYVKIETLEQVADLLQDAKRNGVVAYDFETCSLNRDTTRVVTASFCVGKSDSSTLENPVYKAYVWAGYDKLCPLYDDEELRRFKDAFGDFFGLAGKDFELVAWNMAFDDWVAETFTSRSLPGSTHDAMLEKWCINNERPNDLKTATMRYLGYPNYEAKVHELVREVKARRGRVLSFEDDAEDYEVLKNSFPDVAVEVGRRTGTWKWPASVDKGFAAFAMIDVETLSLYNAYDAVYTYMLHERFKPIIESENLATSYNLRMSSSRMLWQAERRGMLLDVETNRRFSEELSTIIESTDDQLVRFVSEFTEGGIQNFLPNSNQQVAKVLYGDVGVVPVFDRHKLSRYRSEEEVHMICDEIESFVYGDFSEVKELLRNNVFDYNEATSCLEHGWEEAMPYDSKYIPFTDKPLGLGGLGYDPVELTAGGQPSCSKASLLTLITLKDHEFLSLVLANRKAKKLKSTFVDKLFATLRPDGSNSGSYNVTGTMTGRISSSGNLNNQNIPQSLMGQFVARPGYAIVGYDVSQAEVRTLAAFSGDAALKSALESEDLHTSIAAKIYDIPEEEVTKELRQNGKMTTFLLIYQGGADTLGKALGIRKSRAQEIIRSWFVAFPDAARWLSNQKLVAAQSPYYVYTATGTRRSTRNILSNDPFERAKVERIACNTPIQGTAGELVLWNGFDVLRTAHERGMREVYVFATIHDAVYFEVSDDYLDKAEDGSYLDTGAFVDLMREVVARPLPFEQVAETKFPIDVKVGKHWGGEPNLVYALRSKGYETIFRKDLLFTADTWYSVPDEEDGSDEAPEAIAEATQQP